VGVSGRSPSRPHRLPFPDRCDSVFAVMGQPNVIDGALQTVLVHEVPADGSEDLGRGLPDDLRGPHDVASTSSGVPAVIADARTRSMLTPTASRSSGQRLVYVSSVWLAVAWPRNF
jgi:hypothetical protein